MPVGVGLPGVTMGGRLLTAANIDPAWVDYPVADKLSKALKRPVSIVNDADAAGIAEMRFGVGAGKRGVVIFLTLGTGVGSGVFVDGTLVPNTEFGQMEIRGRPAERRSASAARVRRGLSWKAWAMDLDEHLQRIEDLMWPTLFILGGGVSKNADRFIPRLTTRTPVVAGHAAQRRGHHRRGDRGGGRAARTPRAPGTTCRRRSDGRRWPRPDGGLAARPAARSGRIIGVLPRRLTPESEVPTMTTESKPAAEAAAPTVARMLIGGEAVDAADGQTFDVVDPATGRTMATAPLGGREDVDRAVEAARKAFDDRKGWANWAAGKRGRSLSKLADLIKKNSEELAQLESHNVGKPITGSRGEVIGASLVFDYYAGAANKLYGQTIPVSKPGLDLTLREPIGVVGLIVPWNFPILMASWKVAPALAAGNTAILKPASYTPLTAIRLGELALEAGIPPGVLNIVTGPGGTAGASIAAHDGIGKVAFTGETTTGQEIMRLASGNVKKISLELGGKSPNIVFADADLEKFAKESPYSVFDNAGQDCCARSRILVERSAHERVVELFVEATRNVKVGDPADDATEVGTLVSAKQRDRVKDYIEIGLGEGATIVVGGTEPDDPALADGAYLLPTVFDGVSNDMRIAKEEIFGPVVSIIPFDTEEEALRLANATPYGLSGSIWSRDIGKALRAAKALQAGVISVNSNSSVHTEAPFGGYKMSGIGRELGMSALDLYTETKNVFIDIS